MTTQRVEQGTSTPNQLGRYRLVALLARGGMGNVYLSVARGAGGFSKLLAIKELKPELSRDPTYLEMFLAEARLAARLIHPNIVQTNDVGSEGDRHFMAMELLDGCSLRRLERRLGPALSIGARLRIVADVLVGLHHAHELREFDGVPLEIVHRDVSPLNVFVTYDGQAKVLDFGIAKSTESHLQTQVGVFKGRVGYMSPEQAQGMKVDRRADVYAAGIMIWEAAAGRRVWPDLPEADVLARLLREGPPPLRSACPDAPEDLRRLCSKATAWSREARYPTALALLNDLERHLKTRQDVLPLRDVGVLAAQAFVDERRAMRALIERALAPQRDTRPSMPLAALPALVDAAAPPSERTGASHSMRRNRGSLAPMALALTPEIAPEVVPAGAPPSARRWPWQAGYALMASAGGALLATLAVLTLGRGATGWKVGAAPAVAVVDPPRPAAMTTAGPAGESTAPKLINLVVHASPAWAQLAIDDETVEGNPLQTRYPRDGRRHRVGVWADGYAAKWEEVSFANDLSIEISLDRLPEPPPLPKVAGRAPVLLSAVAPSMAPAAAQPALAQVPPPPGIPASERTEVSPRGGRPPSRPIITADPYRDR